MIHLLSGVKTSVGLQRGKESQQGAGASNTKKTKDFHSGIIHFAVRGLHFGEEFSPSLVASVSGFVFLLFG
jgi:hypothetical protein